MKRRLAQYSMGTHDHRSRDPPVCHMILVSEDRKMAAHLSYGKVNLNILREAARKELREFLDKCAGSKVLFV